MTRCTPIALLLTAACSFDASGGAAATDEKPVEPPDLVDAATPPDTLPTIDAAPPDAALPDAGFVTQTLRVSALIDGRSRLSLRGNTAQWRHLDFAAPGRHEGANAPTQVGDKRWLPQWPDEPNPENRDCDCNSDMLVGFGPAVPALTQVVELTELESRASVAILEQPSPANDFAVIVEIDDRDPSGSFGYVFDLVFQGPP